MIFFQLCLHTRINMHILPKSRALHDMTFHHNPSPQQTPAMPNGRPPNLMAPASLDAASPVPMHAHASPGLLSSDAATRLHQTVEADTDAPTHPLRQKTSSLRLATAAARGMVKGLFNIGGKLSAAGSSERRFFTSEQEVRKGS